MDSKSLGREGFEEWHPLDELTISDVPYKQKGVYVFRLRSPLKAGVSDILYIGSSDHLVRRVFGNYFGGVGGKTTKRIHNLLFEEKYLEKGEVGWTIVEDSKVLEKELKVKFRREHRQLPSWNKRL